MSSLVRLANQKQQLETELIRRKLAEYKHDIRGYCRDILGVELWEPVAEALESLDHPPYRTSVDSGHGVGKTFAAAVKVNHHFDTRFPSVGITTAPTQRDVIDLLWTEVRVLRRRGSVPIGDKRLPLPDFFIGPHAPEMREDEEHYAKGFTARKGESLDADTIIDTPGGRRRFGDLQVGDCVFGADGRPVKVTGVYRNGVRPAYLVGMSNGASVVCDANHLWTVTNPNGGARGWVAEKYGRREPEPRTLTTADLIRKGIKFSHSGRMRNKFFLPNLAPLQYECHELDIPAYTMGVWLGDGTCFNGHITTADDAIFTELDTDNPGVLVTSRRKQESRAATVVVRELRGKLRSRGVLGGTVDSKRVPREYMENSVDVRLAVLQGLMDTDGYVDKSGICVFSGTSSGLVDDVIWLVRSLGGRASRQPKQKIKRRPGGGSYRPMHTASVMLKSSPLFRLARKQDRVRVEAREWRAAIDSIEPCGEAEMVCITVDSQDGLFVANDLIVTHNSFQGRHRPNMLFVFDEKEGIDGNYWTAAKSMFRPGSGDAWLVIGNPTTTTSVAYQEHRSVDAKGDPTWHRVRLSCLDHPNMTLEPGEPGYVAGAVTRDQVSQWLADWCDPVVHGDEQATDIEWEGETYRPGPIAEPRILGLRPSAGNLGVWSEALWSLVLRVAPDPLITQLPIIGVDCANYGGDYTVFHVRCGSVSLHHFAVNWIARDFAARIVEKIISLCKEYAAWATKRKFTSAAPVSPSDITVQIDDDATGRAICSWLIRQKIRCVPVNAGSTAKRPDLYGNVRSELWFHTARKAQAGLVNLSRLDRATLQKIELQAMAPEWWPDSAGRRVVESKDDLRDPKRLGRSPDDMDAVNLAYYEPSGVADAKWVEVATAPPVRAPDTQATTVIDSKYDYPEVESDIKLWGKR